MYIKNPLTGNVERVQSVLRSLASQEGCDGDPYDQMTHAADYIDRLEELIQSSAPLSWVAAGDINAAHIYEVRAENLLGMRRKG